MVKVNEIYELQIKKLGINGEGIGYYQKMPFFVDEALPDETVRVRVTEVFPKRIVAEIESIIEASPFRVEVKKPDHQACGAFEMQHVQYEALLKYKRDILIQSLQRYVDKDFTYKKIKPMIGMEDPYHYRNKVSLPARKLKGRNVFGFYAKNSNEFIPIHESPVHDDVINKLTIDLEKWMDELHFDAYIQKDRSGYMKSCVIRRTTHQKEIQVSFLLMKPFEHMEKMVHKMTQKYPEIQSIYVFYTSQYKEQIFFTSQYEKVFGKDTIREVMDEYTFELYPESFFQINTPMAQVFYHKMRELAKLSPKDICIDAYAGLSMISHYIHKDVQSVYAIEMDAKSAQSAKISLSKNQIENVTVIQKDFLKALYQLENKKIDVMFFDPPRTGLGEKTVLEVMKFKPRKIIYGSCNPSTLAKDLSLLQLEYEIKEIVPIDMFPFTPLVESITVLELKKFK